MRSILLLMAMRSRYAVFSLVILAYGVAIGTTTFEPAFKPKLTISKSAGRIDIDGRLEDSGWKSASIANNFVERYPGDKTKPEVETAVYVTHDDDNLYVAFVCYDDPRAIRATMTQRDQFYGNDVVCLLLDTYGEASWAYEFFVNPYGIQKDQLWSSIGQGAGPSEDPGFDLIWESAAAVTDSGYQVEIAVPFASMRFPDGEKQTWKVDFWRNRPRESFKQYSWAAYDRNEQCWVCQWGTMEGITDVRPGTGLGIMPSLMAFQSGERADMRNAGSPFQNSNPDGQLSLGTKYALSSDLTLEAAINPDFSQIEGDATQIDVNSTIALLYPERRPFFQEGSDIFRTLFNSFYSRTINDPQFTLKLTGRTARTSVGFLSARDENTPYMIPLEEESVLLNTGKSTANILRASRTLGEGSHVGLMLNDRRLGKDGSGTILAFDGALRLSKNYSLDGQYILSHTAEPTDTSLTEGLNEFTFDRGRHTIGLDGERYYGTAFITRFRRGGRSWDFVVDYNQVNPSYRTQIGFDPYADYRNASVGSSYTFYLDDRVLQEIVPQAFTLMRWNFEGIRKLEMFNLGVEASTKIAQTGLGLYYERNSEVFAGLLFDNLWSIRFNINGRISDRLGYYLNINHGRGIARYAVAVGRETSLYAGADLKPIDRVVVEPQLSSSRSLHRETGIELFSGYIARMRIQYQANRALSFRLVTQYNDFARRWDIDPLFTYRLSPFSVFYLGSTHDYTDLSDRPHNPALWKLSSRQIFMKLQYLFQV